MQKRKENKDINQPKQASCKLYFKNKMYMKNAGINKINELKIQKATIRFMATNAVGVICV